MVPDLIPDISRNEYMTELEFCLPPYHQPCSIWWKLQERNRTSLNVEYALFALFPSLHLPSKGLILHINPFPDPRLSGGGGNFATISGYRDQGEKNKWKKPFLGH